MRNFTFKTIIFFSLILASPNLFSQDTWTKKANFTGGVKGECAGFSIDGKGYIGTGTNAGFDFQDFWEWDPLTNVWTQKADFPGAARDFGAGFSIGNKGYIGTGGSGGTDFWEWDQTSDAWTQKTSFPGLPRGGTAGFSIGSKGYLGLGASSTDVTILYYDFWEWDQGNDTWVKKADFPGKATRFPFCFSICNKGYVGTGVGLGFSQEVWEWNQSTDVWIKKANFGGPARYTSTGFSIPATRKGYAGMGYDGGGLNDFWEYNMSGIQPVQNLNTCINLPISFINETADSYNWHFGDPSSGALDSSDIREPTHIFSSANTYTVTFFNTSSCSSQGTIKVKVDPIPTVNAGVDQIICIGKSAALSASVIPAISGTKYSWSPATGLSNTAIASPIAKPAITTTYTVEAAIGKCTSTDSLKVSLYPPFIASAGIDQTICIGQSGNLNASSVPPNFGAVYLWSPEAGLDNTAISSPIAKPTITTTYSVEIVIGLCKNQDSITVFVVPPIAVLVEHDLTINYGNSTILTAIPFGNYLWTPSTGLSCITCSKVNAQPSLTTTYSIKYTDSYGCSSIDEVIVNVNPFCGNPFVPDAFSPNKDDINDMLYININPSCVQEISFSVFDRWGVKIFNSDTVKKGWDGTLDGSEINTGVYFYYLNILLFNSVEPIVQKGNVTLIR